MVRKQTFTLGSSTIPGEFIIPRLLSGMIDHLPEIELKIDVGDSLKIFEGVRNGRYEIGIVGTRFESPEVEFRTIIENDRLVIIAPKAHPLAAKGTLSPGDLSGQNMVTREKGSGTRAAYEKAFRDAGLSDADLNIVAEVGTTEAVIQAVEGGAGIGVVSELAAKEAIELGKIAVLSIPLLRLTRDFCIITRRGVPLSKDASEVLAVIKMVMR